MGYRPRIPAFGGRAVNKCNKNLHIAPESYCLTALNELGSFWTIAKQQAHHYTR
ncbi:MULTISPECIES: hypothetical protein [unclassified Microcoleus]|uniref:hypothetical protein n=1 Tax=unclassified Microcoleus TaxID=2642155 RepID=UPI002FCEC3D9